MDNSVHISNIPFELTKSQLIEGLSPLINGKITECHLKNHATRYGWNCGWATIHFEQEEDAERLLRKARHWLHGRPLNISKAKKRTIHSVSAGTEYLVDSLELGSWSGVSVANKNKRRSQNEETVRTFLSEYKHPEYWKLQVQKREFIKLIVENEGRPNVIYINARVLDEQCKGVIIDTSREYRDELVVYLTLKHPPELHKQLEQVDALFSELNIDINMYHDDNWTAWSRCGDWTGDHSVFGQFLVYRLVLKENLQSIKKALTAIDANLQDCLVKYKNPHPLDETMDEVIYPLLPFKINFKLECLLSHNVLTVRE
ncbi:4959_t:CDS:1, partial [Paraglomus brasilianum]